MHYVSYNNFNLLYNMMIECVTTSYTSVFHENQPWHEQLAKLFLNEHGHLSSANQIKIWLQNHHGFDHDHDRFIWPKHTVLSLHFICSPSISDSSVTLYHITYIRWAKSMICGLVSNSMKRNLFTFSHT